MKIYRFFFHYRKRDGRMSVHFRDRCIPCEHVECDRPCKTKWNKWQPYLVMQGWAIDIHYEFRTDTVYIQ